MAFNWKILDELSELLWDKDLRNFAGTASFEVGSTREILTDIRGRRQWPNIENIIRFFPYKRIFGAGGGRSLKKLKYFTKTLEMKGYTGGRRACFTTDEELPSHNPNTDTAILASCSMTSPEAVKEARIFVEEGVNTSIITATSPKMLKKRMRTEQIKDDAWRYLEKQKNWEKLKKYEKPVFYLSQRETEEKKEFAALSTLFEFKLGISSIGLGNCIALYHDLYDVVPNRCDESETIPLKTISDTVEAFFYYSIKHLIPSFHKYQDRIHKLIQLILDAQHIRHVSPYLNSIEGKCLEIRLGTLGYKKNGKSVRAITSENYGPEGSSQLKSDTLLIINALAGNEVFAYQISKEAKKKKVQEIVYVGDPDSKIAKNATLVIPIPEVVHRYNGVISLGYPAIGVLYDSVASQLKHALHYTENMMRKEHSPHG